MKHTLKKKAPALSYSFYLAPVVQLVECPLREQEVLDWKPSHEIPVWLTTVQAAPPWRSAKNYPSIIIKYPPYLFFWLFRQTGLGKQCRPGSDYSSRCSLVRVYIVCHAVCIFWKHKCTVKPHCSKFRTITAIFSGVQFFLIFKVS